MYAESGSNSSSSEASQKAVSSAIKETKADTKATPKVVSLASSAQKTVSDTSRKGEYDVESMEIFSNLGDEFTKNKDGVSIPGDNKNTSNVNTSKASSVSHTAQANNAKNLTPGDYSWASKNSFKIARMFGLDGISDYEILNEGSESTFLQAYGISKKQAVQSAGLNNTVQTKVASNVKTKDYIPAVNKTQINNTNIQSKTNESSNKDLTDSFVLS